MLEQLRLHLVSVRMNLISVRIAKYNPLAFQNKDHSICCRLVRIISSIVNWPEVMCYQVTVHKVKKVLFE